VIWTGQRTVDCRRHNDPSSVWPVRVCADAIAPGMPMRDLLLSPDHAVFIDETLVPVRALLNGLTVRQEPVDSIEYFHLELASHDVILAEGLPAETYLDTGNRNAFENAGPSLQLHPRFARLVHTALACAPFAESGRVVEQAHARILARAEASGFVRAEGAWRVEADGVVLGEDTGGYNLPAGTRMVRILSQAWSPAEMETGNRDPRRLGLCLTGLSLDGAAIALNDPVLCAGFHPVETDGVGQWRWTDGAATLDFGGLVSPVHLMLAVARAPMVWQAAA